MSAAKQTRAKAPPAALALWEDTLSPSQLYAGPAPAVGRVAYAEYAKQVMQRWQHRCTCGHQPCWPWLHAGFDRGWPGVIEADGDRPTQLERQEAPGNRFAHLEPVVFQMPVSFPDPEPPGVGLAGARARCTAICGLTWAEQESLTQELRIELWALVQGGQPGLRAQAVAEFRAACAADIAAFVEARRKEHVQ